MSAAAATLEVLVNDRPHALAGPATLAGLLSELGLAEKRGVAAAVNGTVVPRAAWESRELAGGDRVLVIRATQGG
ncbi:MAG TPA: sulfur carrier protein ThiS [Opitutaceae bacterium]|nr:sulfur carrier protein ThiS [Opitutaceae bacterium]